MFLPGFAMGDEALRPMARVIERLGYTVSGWQQGRNLGLRARVLERLLRRLQEQHERDGLKFSLVGWSAGGLYAREIARVRPDWVRRIITLGSPIRPHQSGQEIVEGFRRAFESFLADRGYPSFHPDLDAPPVPCTAIYSKRDGVVAWRAAMETAAPNTENVEVEGTHLGLGFNLEVLRIVAERLATAV
ncbi:MAG: alpha/beta hydrolase [Panacagrimonas sp.]